MKELDRLHAQNQHRKKWLHSDCLQRESNFLVQRIWSLACACAFAAFTFAFNSAKVYVSLRAIMQNTHTHKAERTRQWPDVNKPKTYSVVEGNQSIASGCSSSAQCVKSFIIQLDPQPWVSKTGIFLHFAFIFSHFPHFLPKFGLPRWLGQTYTLVSAPYKHSVWVTRYLYSKYANKIYYDMRTYSFYLPIPKLQTFWDQVSYFLSGFYGNRKNKLSYSAIALCLALIKHLENQTNT